MALEEVDRMNGVVDYVDNPDRIKHLEEVEHRDKEPLDKFSVDYMRGLRKRIIEGVRPEKPLIETRPELLYYRKVRK